MCVCVCVCVCGLIDMFMYNNPRMKFKFISIFFIKFSLQ